MSKQLNKLNNKEFLLDVKQFINSSHNFYGKKNPEIKTLANRLHQEYKLNSFYNVFNRLWNAGYHNERVLAVHTLELYEEDYDKETWRFLIPKLKKIKDFDEAEKIGRIIGTIIVKYPAIKNEIVKILNSKNAYYRSIVLSSCFPLIKNKDWPFIFRVIKNRLYDRETNIQKLNGRILLDISINNKTIVKEFILKNIGMPQNTFDIVSEKFKDLGKRR